jgi:hypothetical protein
VELRRPDAGFADRHRVPTVGAFEPGDRPPSDCDPNCFDPNRIDHQRRSLRQVRA